MNEQQLISHIEDLGLSNKEARVYVACLKTGPSAVQRIADQADIKRVTTYVVLESLVGLGLVSQSVKGKKTYYIAESPTNLKRLLEKRERELHDQQTSFGQILPELEALKSTPKDSPHVKFYDGADGIRAAMTAFIEQVKNTDRQMVYGYSNVDRTYSLFPELEQKQANAARLKAGLPSRFLYASERGPFLKEGDQAANRESRWVPKELSPMDSDFTIIGDTVMMLSLASTNPMAVTITSKEVAQGIRALYEMAWTGASKYN
jgi:sugar-specific transcriptional regulator TrmB